MIANRPSGFAFKVWVALVIVMATLAICGRAFGQVPAPGFWKFGKACAKAQGAAYGPHWDPMLLAQVHVESRWIPTARSPVGARGISQFMPQTQRAIERQYSLAGSIWKPEYACTLQGYLMRDLAREFGPLGDGFLDQWGLALRAYNGSPRTLKCELAACGWPRTLAGVRPCRCRKPAYWAENVSYPEKIFRVWPAYAEAWGP